MEFKKGDKIRLIRDYPLAGPGESVGSWFEVLYPKGTVFTFNNYGPYLTVEGIGPFFYRDDFELVEE